MRYIAKLLVVLILCGSTCSVAALAQRPGPRPRPGPAPKAKPAPKPQPKPAPKPQPRPAPKPLPKPAPKPAPRPQPNPPTRIVQPQLGVDANEIEVEIFRLTNEFRRSLGLSELSWNAKLARAAQAHSQRMAELGVIDHTLDQGDFEFRIRQQGYLPVGRQPWTIGENLFAGWWEIANPIDAMEGWKNSPDHLRNLMNGEFTEIGVGVRDGNSYYFYTQDFGGIR